MTQVGLGGEGWLAVCYETTMGTYVPPTDPDTVWVPILDENLAYNEAAYYSPQIRQETIESSREQGYYHVEGTINTEFDANSAPLFWYASRHDVAESGGGANPYVYAFTPSSAAAASSTRNNHTKPKTLSITVVRNGIGFGYAGCVVQAFHPTIDTGVLKIGYDILGLSEAEPNALSTPVWVDPDLMGAASHSVYVDGADINPAFANASQEFNGFSADINYNGAAQNRIVPNRAATYISYGQTEATYNTELDFSDRSEYDNFVNNTRRAIRLMSVKDGDGTWNGSDEGFRLTMYNTAYDTYPVGLSGMADLIMSQVTGRALAITGGVPLMVEIKTPTDAAKPSS